MKELNEKTPFEKAIEAEVKAHKQLTSSKKKVEMKDLGKAHTKQHLLRLHPFLKNKFRDIDKKEIKSVEVFKELFGNDAPVELYKLRAIYEYQK